MQTLSPKKQTNQPKTQNKTQTRCLAFFFLPCQYIKATQANIWKSNVDDILLKFIFHTFHLYK